MSFRKITVKSGNEESTLEVTEEEYRNYYRPWWLSENSDNHHYPRSLIIQGIPETP